MCSHNIFHCSWTAIVKKNSHFHFRSKTIDSHCHWQWLKHSVGYNFHTVNTLRLWHAIIQDDGASLEGSGARVEIVLEGLFKSSSVPITEVLVLTTGDLTCILADFTMYCFLSLCMREWAKQCKPNQNLIMSFPNRSSKDERTLIAISTSS